MVASWDSDFIFADGPKHGDAKSSTLVPSQASGTIEDWDVELLPGESKRDRQREPRATPNGSGSEDVNDVELDSEDDGSVASSLFSYDHGQSHHRLETLLEYLDSHEADTDDTTDIPIEKPLPRPPLLFSAYRRPGGHSTRGLSSLMTKEEDICSAFTPRDSSAWHQARGPVLGDPRLSRDLSMTSQTGVQRGKRIQNPVMSPHAPESAQGVVSWLINLSAKVRSTRAVVARPTPKTVDCREFERLPSEEVALERQLRIAEMIYCSAESGLHVADAIHKVKLLLRRIDATRSKRLKASQSNALIELDMDSPICDDLETRTSQCAARLVRLTCRVAQLCDSMSNTLHEQLDSADVAMLRRCCLALASDIRADHVARLGTELLVDEALSHLALLHCRARRGSKLCTANENCWCSALPPIPRASFSRIVELGRNLACRSQLVEELEATALADILLDSMGYSPLTAEEILCEDDVSLQSSDESVDATPNVPLRRKESDVVFVARDLELQLAAYVRVLPATSLARAKVALALGICHLRGGERLRGTAAATHFQGENASPCVGSTSKSTRSCRPSHLKKQAGCVTSISDGNARGTASFFLSKNQQLSPLSYHVAQTELRAAEMLLFEATCVLEQHATTQPIDLPFYACQYGSELLHNTSAVGRRAATLYSALACSLGFTAIRALARVLDRRSKHTYAVLALEVCISILELRDDLNERHRLQRELAVVSARQGGRDCSRYCIRVLKDLDDRFYTWCHKVAASRIPSGCRNRDERNPHCRSMKLQLPGNKLGLVPTLMVHTVVPGIPHVQNLRCDLAAPVDMSAAALANVDEAALVTELVASRAGKLADDEDGARMMLIELLFRIGNRAEMACKEAASAFELQALQDRIGMGLAKLELDLYRRSEAAAVIDACLGSGRKSSLVRRIALLSWSAKVHLDLGDTRGCDLALCRINRLRASPIHHERHRQTFSLVPPSKVNRVVFAAHQGGGGVCSNLRRLCMTPLLAGEEGRSGVASSIQSCLLSHCGSKHDVGELAACCDLANDMPHLALQHLAPTVAAVETVVSKLGTHDGLFELGRLYRLRGVAQEALSRSPLNADDFPLRVSQLKNDRIPKRRCANSRTNRSQPSVNESACAVDVDAHKIGSGVLPVASCSSQARNSSGSDDGAPFVQRVARVVVPYGAVASKTRCMRMLAENSTGSHLNDTRRHPVISTSGSHETKIREDADTMYQTVPAFSLQQHSDSPSKRTRRRRSLWSRHYRAYTDSDDLALDALRWYRHALECFKSRDDDAGVASSASAFTRLQLERVMIPVAFKRVPLSDAVRALRAERAKRAQSPRELSRSPCRLYDIDAAARCALSLAALVCEPLLLLETYLNVAEARLLHRDRMGAIAHWWEARELFLRLFVVRTSIPALKHCRGDVRMLESLRAFLERLIRFLFACDSAMINENVLLLEVLVLFERDARMASHSLDSRFISVLRNSPTFRMTMALLLTRSNAWGCLNLEMERRASHYAGGLSRKHEIWECIARARDDVRRHRQRAPFSQICELRDKNRATLRVLAARMRMLSEHSSHKPSSSWKQVWHGSPGLHQCCPTVYVLHVASMMILYCPLTGARHTVAFGRSACSVSSRQVPTLAPLKLSSNQEAYRSLATGTECLSDCKDSGSSQMRQGGLSLVSAEFVSEIAVEPGLGKVKDVAPRNLWTSWKESVAHGMSSHETVTQVRKSRVEGIARDLALPEDGFSQLVAGHGTARQLPANISARSSPRIHIVCSERAQLLPWECIAGSSVCISRDHCVQAQVPLLRETSLAPLSADACSIDSLECGASWFCGLSTSMKRVRACLSSHHTCLSLQSISRKKMEANPVHFVPGLVPWYDVAVRNFIFSRIFELCSQEAVSAMQKALMSYDTCQDDASGRHFTSISSEDIFRALGHGRSCASNVSFKSGFRAQYGEESSNGVLVLDLVRLYVQTHDIDAFFDNYDPSFILYVPAPFLKVVRAALRKLYEALPDSVDLAVTPTSAKSRNPKIDGEILASFAHQLSLKYSVPIVHYVRSRQNSHSVE